MNECARQSAKIARTLLGWLAAPASGILTPLDLADNRSEECASLSFS